MILLALALKLLNLAFLSILCFPHAISQISYEKWKCTALKRIAENSCSFMAVAFNLIPLKFHHNHFWVQSCDFSRTESLADIPINWILAPRFPRNILVEGECKRQAFLLFLNQAFNFQGMTVYLFNCKSKPQLRVNHVSNVEPQL